MIFRFFLRERNARENFWNTVDPKKMFTPRHPWVEQCKMGFHPPLFKKNFTPLPEHRCIGLSICMLKDEKGCPRCGGAVFQAEEIIEKGISFHKKCFTCCQCTRPLNDKLQVFIGFDNEVYCKVCYPSITHTPLPLDPSDKSKVKGKKS